MTLRVLSFYFSCVFVFSACSQQPQSEETASAEPPQKPNIIFILADDLGYGDLSTYGQTPFETPNLDRLAQEGMKFTQHYSGSTVCAPSRSVIMTGKHTGHTFIRGNKEVQPEGQYPLADSIRTLPEMLKEHGYVTGAFGKWGLGYPGSEGDPLNQGFDRFFGYNCQRLGHHYYPYYLWDNDQKLMLEANVGKEKGTYAPKVIQDQTLDFIEQNQDTSFFLFVPSIIPHAELAAPEEYMAKYRGKFLPEKVYEGYDDGPDYRQGPYESQAESHAAFAAMVNVLDDQVGEIITKLEEVAAAYPSFSLEVTEVKMIGRGVAYKLESELLMKLHRQLAKVWQDWLTPQDRQKLWPHITVQNKVEAAKARALHEKLAESFAPFTVRATGLKLWEYKGGPWEWIKSFSF